jgi:hypothetical protein
MGMSALFATACALLSLGWPSMAMSAEGCDRSFANIHGEWNCNAKVPTARRLLSNARTTRSMSSGSAITHNRRCLPTDPGGYSCESLLLGV